MFNHIPYKSKHNFIDYPEVVDVLDLDEDGCTVIVTGQTNQQEKIDSYAQEVSIQNIIKQCADLRDLSAVGKNIACVDRTLPEDVNSLNAYIESKIATAQKLYASLSPEVKSQFKNFTEFLTGYEAIYKQNPITETPTEKESEK